MPSITEEQSSYLAASMDAVSRTFALVVAGLEEPLGHTMATAYLLCRVADNIEDGGQALAWQQARYAELQHLLQSPASAATTLAAWERLAWPELATPERRMMGMNGLPLWEIYAALKEENRRSICKWVSAMAEGMAKLSDPAMAPHLVNHDGVAILADVSDYNEYCYYVAGTVGHMATEIVAQYYGFSSEATAALTSTSEACGRGLQKTNILKDFADDLQRGYSYLPKAWMEMVDFSPLSLRGAPAAWKQMVVADVVDDLRTATDYVTELPLAASGYRMASLLCLLPAYQTLLLAAKRQPTLFTDQHQVKISRPAMASCQWDAKSMLSNNDSIRSYGARIEQELEGLFADAA